ncbi:MAG: DUF1553 domain-containing protein [Adhaeribacter sp.]
MKNHLFKRLALPASLAALALAGFWSCSEPDLPREVAAVLSELPDQVDYNVHVKPILSDRCFACHGPDKNKIKGDLRLDLADAHDKVGESARRALVPGNLAKSEVFHRIISEDPEYRMPTPESHLTLTAREKAILIKWIQDGAEYKPHWSLVAAEKPKLPEVKQANWVRNSIDRFVLAKLEEKGLKPNQEASRETLIRRLSFDLTGLPPTLAEIDAFLADKSPRAYEKVVDRLLRSPHFGERMAVDWLDAARYADTHGYQDDGLRNSYPWRDWVISAFNRNLPYDKFITWQLAGDLVPKAGKEQILATSFLRNHPQSQEGGIVDEEYRTEYVLDRVNTFGKTFLAYSVECARCHDHKYDPISQKNYYQLAAFFNSNNESGQIPYTGEASPTLILTTPASEKTLQYIRTRLQPLARQAANHQPYQAAFAAWKQNPVPAAPAADSTLVGDFSFDAMDPANPKDPCNQAGASPFRASYRNTDKEKRPVPVPGRVGKGLRLDGDMFVEFSNHFTTDRNQPVSVSLWVKPLPGHPKGPLFSRTNGELDGSRGYICEINQDQTLDLKFSHVFPANAIHVQSKHKLKLNAWNHVVMTYDGSSKARGIRVFLNGSQVPLTVLQDHLQQSMMYAINKTNWGIRNFRVGQQGNKTIEKVAFDELKAYKRQLSRLEVRQLAGRPHLVEQLRRLPEAKLSQAQRADLFEYYLLAVDPQYRKLQQQLAVVRGEENNLLTDQEEVMVYSELKKPRPTFILDRGVYDAPTTRVEAGTPEAILTFDEDLPRNRLGLSRWLLSEENPLFARVTVNRFWQQCFGQGLVKTGDDFGNQGEMPSHALLLDYLALRFRENKWNVKALLKEMVMSATYRQSSVPTRQALNKDPDNKLLSRAPSYRMTAEMIRDNALAASGLLVRKVGGKSVYPYQPAGVWEALAVRNAIKYEQGKGEDLYRRTLYTVWKRSSPNPALISFDVPDRYACSVNRQKTSTPLQALVLLNDVQFVEAARLLGERMVKQGGSTPAGRIGYAFRSLTSRRPRPKELQILLSLYRQEYAGFKKSPERAAQLLGEGEWVADASLPADEVATCTVVASTLMNFDEFTMKR